MPTDYISEAITAQWSERCPEFAEGCACCEAWRQYDRLREERRRACELRDAVVEERNQALGMVIEAVMRIKKLIAETEKARAFHKSRGKLGMTEAAAADIRLAALRESLQTAEGEK